VTHSDPPFLVVGHLNKPHGTKGEFFVWPLTDRKESVFQVGAEVLVANEDGDLPDDRFSALRIEEIRPFKRGLLLRFEGIGTRNEAELIRDRYILLPFDRIEPLDEGDVFYHQLLGMTVVTTGGEEIGRVSEVYELEPADMLEVSGAGRTLLVPFTEQIVVSVEAEERRLVVDPPEGLLDL
jgi:16S rRNA processing protein RimM